MFEINLQDIPTQPGVYTFLDGKNRIIYVGKAKSLRNRLASYFNASVKTVKTVRMLENATQVKTIVTSNEVEAFLLESNLIKTEQPKYNILLKDSKGYPYVKLTGDEYPKFLYTRQIYDKSATYFGPFVNSGELKEMLEFLKDMFPLRSCGDQQLRAGKICLKYQIRKCLGPCEGLISKADYMKLVEEVKSFFEGHTQEVKGMLKEKMEEASEKLEFELAAFYRDRLKALSGLFSRQNAIDISEKRSLDVFYRHEIKNTVGVTQLFLRGGMLLGAKTHFFSADEDDLLERFILQFYSNMRQFPDMIAAEGGEISDTMTEALSAMADKKIILRKRGYSELFELARTNAIKATDEYLIKASTNSNLFEKLAKIAGREVSRVECMDISHLGGDNTVGVSVVGVDGHFYKKDYRKYRIRTAGNNDVQSIKELMQRKMSNVEEGSETEADLYLIDGGVSQLNAAYAVLKEAGSSSCCLSISKSRSMRPNKFDSDISIEEIHAPGRKNPLKFKKNDSVMLFFQKMRDEAHRFAITYSRSLSLKKRKVSPLLEIPGMGAKRAKAVLMAIPDLYYRANLTAEYIKETAKIPLEQAEGIIKFLDKFGRDE